jgi:hypothetical protein
MKTYGGVTVQIQVFLTSALVGGEWSASRPGRFTPGKIAQCTHWIGGWMGLRAGLDDVQKILDLIGTRNFDPSAVQPVTSHYIDCAIPAPTHMYIYTYIYTHILHLACAIIKFLVKALPTLAIFITKERFCRKIFWRIFFVSSANSLIILTQVSRVWATRLQANLHLRFS